MNNSKKNTKSVMYIGGSRPQIAGILCAKASNLNVVVTDRFLNAPANKVGDKFENIAADDTKDLLKLALNLNKENDFVGAYGVADYAYTSIGEIYDKLNLPYGSKNLYKKMANKHISREIWESCNISVPRGVSGSSNNFDISNLNFPLVVKPSNSYNSQGLQTVYKYDKLSVALKDAFKYSKSVVLEELIEGRHFNVDMVFVNGEAFPGGITERFFVDSIDHQALSGIQGSEFNELDVSQLYNLVISACDAIGFNYGPVTADIILKGNKLYIIEISPHFHAISISSVINLDCVLKGWFAYLSEDANWRTCMQFSVKKYAAYFYILSDSEGTINNIKGLNLIKAMPGFVDLELKYEIGSKIKKTNSKKIYCGMVILKSETYKELFDNLDLLNQSVRVMTK